MASLATSTALSARCSDLASTIEQLRKWIELRQFAGHEPYDILNAPLLRGKWARRPPLSFALIQFGRRFGGGLLRKLLKIPASRNPKALALCLAAYCDLARMGYNMRSEADWLKVELLRLRSPLEVDYCWGYDWDFMSLRGTRLPAFSANSIASYFCGTALLDMFEVFGDERALNVAGSVARFLTSRLNHSFESRTEVCFSYTPNDETLIFNNSALIAAFLARVGRRQGNREYLALAKRGMEFLVRRQMESGAWPYGCLRRQQWIDSFHTSYNLCAMRDYREFTGDREFDDAILRGHRYYKQAFFTSDGVPKYFHNRTFPIDIHACSQAILHFAAFSCDDPESIDLAWKVFEWTKKNMLSPDGTFYFQKHRIWTDRTPYMRWGQAWMLRALSRLLLVGREEDAVLGPGE